MGGDQFWPQPNPPDLRSLVDKMPPIPPAAPHHVVQIVAITTIRIKPDGSYDMLGTETKVVPVS